MIEDRIDAAIVETAVEGEAHMKTHAPWDDDTGAARAALTATADTEGSAKEITFTNAVDYGFVLETMEHGKFEIVMPTVTAMGERFMGRIEGMLDEI